VMSPTPRTRRREGFTLIELLMVIGIIALLAAVVITAVGRVVEGAKIAATKATIGKINGLLTKRMEAFNRAIADQEQAAKGSGNVPSYVVQASQGLPTLYKTNPTLARARARKIIFQRNFPQTYAEAGLNGNPTPSTESAAALYYMLTSMPAF